MAQYLPILALVALALGLWLWAWARSTWALIVVDDGKVDVRRGELSASMRRDVQEAVRLSGLREGRIRLVARKKGLEVRVRPSHEGLEQRLRNTIATWGQ